MILHIHCLSYPLNTLPCLMPHKTALPNRQPPQLQTPTITATTISAIRSSIPRVYVTDEMNLPAHSG